MIKFQKWNCNLTFSKYLNDRTAIMLIDADDGSPVAIASVNLPETAMDDDEIAIKDYSENDGILEILVENKIVSEPIRFVKSGYVEIPICKLLINE